MPFPDSTFGRKYIFFGRDYEFDGSIRNFCEITRMLYPNCRICYGEDDQIVIYTGAMLEMGGEVCQWEPEDEDQYRAWCDRHPEVCGGKF